MIDIHSHTLFGLDDGCFQLETSLEVLKEESQGGVTDIFCTPHIDTDDFPFEMYNEHFNILENKINETGINVKIHKGAEIGPNFLPSKLINKGINLTLGENGKYALIGPFFESEYSKNTFDAVIYDLQMIGKIPIIAHPERMEYFRKDPDILTTFLNRGCLLQMNCQSLMGKYGEETQKFAIEILKLGWISFIGSDNHRRHEYSVMQKTYSHIKSNYGEHVGKELMIDNPKMILNNQAIVNYNYRDWNEPKKVKNSFFSFLFKKNK